MGSRRPPLARVAAFEGFEANFNLEVVHGLKTDAAALKELAGISEPLSLQTGLDSTVAQVILEESLVEPGDYSLAQAIAAVLQRTTLASDSQTEGPEDLRHIAIADEQLRIASGWIPPFLARYRSRSTVQDHHLSRAHANYEAIIATTKDSMIFAQIRPLVNSTRRAAWIMSHFRERVKGHHYFGPLSDRYLIRGSHEA